MLPYLLISILLETRLWPKFTFNSDLTIDKINSKLSSVHNLQQC